MEAYSERSVREEGMDELGEGTSEAEGMELQEDASSPCGVEGTGEVEEDGKGCVFVVERLSYVVVENYERIYCGGVAVIGVLVGGDGL